MRTTLNLPESLVLKAMKLSKSINKTKTIILALENLIRKSQISSLKNYKSKIDLDIDLNMLRKRK